MTIARARAHEEALCTPRRAPLDPRREETIVALARRSIAIAAVVVALLVGCTTPTTPPLEQIQREVAICPEGPTLKGIDVSKWQGTIDWDKVAADGVIYAFIRVSDGFTLDGQFAFNWAEAKRVGVIRGVYQFFRPGKDAVDQANLLLDQMGPLGDDDLPPVLDVEAIDGQGPEVIVAKIHQWVSTIETALGRRPIIYSGRYFWNDNVGTTDFSSYPLWIPAYGPTCPTLPNAWSEWVFFQFSSTGAVKGIVGNVDMNQFNGDHDALLGFIASTQIACGNGICEGGETPTNCPSDCPLCEPIPPAGRVVDESEICFEKGGDPQYWRDVQEGYGDGLLWTKTTSNANPANFAVWHLDFELGGEYRIEAYLKAPWAESKQAAYQIRHNGQTETVVVDTSTADGWLEIGTFVFAVGADQWVRVDDNTGEPSSSDTMLVADALRVTNLNPPPDTSEPDTSEPDTRDDTNAPETVTPEIDVGNPTVDAGDPDGTIGQDTSGNGNKSAGCQLLAGDAPTTGSSSAMIGLLLGLVAFWCRRRRIRLGRIAALLLGIIAISALLPTTAWANDGSFGGKGAALLPLKQTAIRMLSEEIVIEQREEPPRNKKRSGRLAFWVTARYRFENPTNRPVALQLGFPETHCDRTTECNSRVNGAFQDLRTLVRNKPVKHRVGRVSKTHRWAPRLGKVYLYDVRFAPKETVEIHHSYRFDRSTDVMGETVFYVTRTGALWNGPIGRARFTIRLPYRPYHLGYPKEFVLTRYDERHTSRGNTTEIVFEMKRWQPKGDLMLHLGNGQETVAGCPSVVGLVSGLERTKRSRADYVKEQLTRVTTANLTLCRNMVYALHGYTFRKARLTRTFYGPPKPSKSDALFSPGRGARYLFLRFRVNPHYDVKLLSHDEQLYVRAVKEEEKRRAAK